MRVFFFLVAWPGFADAGEMRKQNPKGAWHGHVVHTLALVLVLGSLEGAGDRACAVRRRSVLINDHN